MWNYQNTDDMYVGRFSDRKDNYLQHYKYLKKVKTPSGKVRYIYDESELKAYDAIYKDVKNQVNSQDGYKYKAKDGRTVIVKGDYQMKLGFANRDNGKQSLSDSIKEKRYESYANHNTQKIKDIPKKIISKGIGFVNQILINLEKKWVK